MSSCSIFTRLIGHETPQKHRLLPDLITLYGHRYVHSRSLFNRHIPYTDMTPKIIGLTGPKGVGKSTYAKSIEGAVILSFATPIKEMLKIILPGQRYLNFKEEPIPKFPEDINARKLLQSLGTEWGRESVYPNIWVDQAYKAAEPFIGKKTIVFDDIRFPNEGWAIRRWGHAHEVLSEIVHISRKGHEPDLNETHVSEAGLPKGMIDKWVTVEDGKA